MNDANLNYPIAITNANYRLYWLVTGVLDRPIDFNWMSTSANRRDLWKGVSGMFTALNPDTCFLELGITRNDAPPGTYLVTFDAFLKLGDYRSIPSLQWSGSYYDPTHNFSHVFYSGHSGQMIADGCDGIIRYSQKAISYQDYQDVIVLRETALPKLNVVDIERIGMFSPSPLIRLYGTDKSILWSKTKS